MRSDRVTLSMNQIVPRDMVRLLPNTNKWEFGKRVTGSKVGSRRLFARSCLIGGGRVPPGSVPGPCGHQKGRGAGGRAPTVGPTRRAY